MWIWKCLRNMPILSGALLSACTWEPMFNLNAPIKNKIYENVEIQAPEGRSDYVFYQLLKGSIKDNSRGRYNLTYNTQISAQSVAVDNNDESLRVKLTGIVVYRLINAEKEEILANGSLRRSLSYSKPPTSVADDVARRTLSDDLMAQLASDLLEEINIISIQAQGK